MTLFLGPFGFLAAGLAVVLESWFFVKIFVGSFLIKGMIGEEVFEAVHFSPLRGLIPGPSTTVKRLNTRTEIEKGVKPQPRRSSYQSSSIVPTWCHRAVPSHPPSRLHSVHRMGAVRLS